MSIMAINFGRVGIYNEEFPKVTRSLNQVVLQGHVTVLAAVSLLPQGL